MLDNGVVKHPIMVDMLEFIKNVTYIPLLYFNVIIYYTMLRDMFKYCG